jgi:hypothetical protein
VKAVYPYHRSAQPQPKMISMQLARAYVPDQPYSGLFPLDEALKKGTLFPNLAFPYAVKSKE